jgi:transglutaminase-like putative cysteine protease
MVELLPVEANSRRDIADGTMTISNQDFLMPGRFIDSRAPNIVEFASEVTNGASGQIDRVLQIYLAVRDRIAYDPYLDYSDPTCYRASEVLVRGRGFCIGKAALLAAATRAIGIPARVGYADVRNHMTSPRLYERIKTDIFIWHSYAELQLNGVWVKATPAFDAALCERLGLKPLDFDGRSDSLFQPIDPAGRRHMEYLKDRGSFADVPFETIMADMRIHYPALISRGTLSGDFRSEAVPASGKG